MYLLGVQRDVNEGLVILVCTNKPKSGLTIIQLDQTPLLRNLIMTHWKDESTEPLPN